MAVYDMKYNWDHSFGPFRLIEHHIYGSSRLRKTNFQELNKQNLSDDDFSRMAETQGSVYDVNSAKNFYNKHSGKGEVKSIFDDKISEMTNIKINGKTSTQSDLMKMIKTEKLGPEWEATWAPNGKGVMELSNFRTNNDLTSADNGPNLAHLHPNTSKPYLITYNTKYL